MARHSSRPEGNSHRQESQGLGFCGQLLFLFFAPVAQTGDKQVKTQSTMNIIKLQDVTAAAVHAW